MILQDPWVLAERGTEEKILPINQLYLAADLEHTLHHWTLFLYAAVPTLHSLLKLLERRKERRREGGGRQRQRQKDMEKALGGVVERHSAGLNLEYCTSSTVFTSHGLLKGSYYVTPSSITRLFSGDLITACTHKCTQGNGCNQLCLHPFICKNPWYVLW